MPLESLAHLVQRCRDGRYVLGYFGGGNLESIWGVLDVAEHTRLPMVIGLNGAFLSDTERLESERLGPHGAKRKATAESFRLGRPLSKDPKIIEFGGRYRMYFSLPPFAAKLAPGNTPADWSVGIAGSRDLLNWKKVGELWTEQECENRGPCTPSAIVREGKVHLVYASTSSKATTTKAASGFSRASRCNSPATGLGSDGNAFIGLPFSFQGIP